jgi:hypothetical protein
MTETYIKNRDKFGLFIKKFKKDIPKINDNYRDFYIEIVEDLYPKLKDIGQSNHTHNTISSLNKTQLELLGFIHYRLKFDMTPIDEATQRVFNEIVETLLSGEAN